MRTTHTGILILLGCTNFGMVFAAPPDGTTPPAVPPPAMPAATGPKSEPEKQPGKPIVESGMPAAPGAARIELVFVLDTTGSMGGLLEGAKRKIWAIANAVTQASPRPQILMGLVAFRDRGDQYVTRITPLTEDLDLVYSNLMNLTAGGGGDEPESVNQALAEAMSRSGWSAASDNAKLPTLQILYLVGDSPPHMDYADDVKHPQSCALAAERGLFINTIQCGATATTTPIWQTIAREGKGAYFKIDQSGGVRTIATPFDEELAKLGNALQETLIDYGDKATMAQQLARRDMQQSVVARAPASAEADRVVFNNTGAGQRNLIGRQELVDDIAAGRVKLKDIPADQLPKAMQELSLAAREKFIQEKTTERQRLSAEIDVVSKKRAAFLREAGKGEKHDSFDAAVIASLREQAAKRRITIPDPK